MNSKTQTSGLHSVAPDLHKKIFALAKNLGLDTSKNGTLYDLVESVSGIRSISNLSIPAAKSIINQLQKMLDKLPAQKGKNVIYLLSPKQLSKILALKYILIEKINWSPSSVDSLAKRMYTRPIKLLKPGQAVAFIEALRAIILRHKINPETGDPV